MRIWPLLAALAFTGFLLWIFISPVSGAVFNVGNPLGFQTALATSAVNGQDDVVVNVAAGTYNVTFTLQYSSSENYALAINGAGSNTTIKAPHSRPMKSFV